MTIHPHPGASPAEFAETRIPLSFMMKFLGGMRTKILLLMLLAGFLPLVFTSLLFYENARNFIVSDRVEIYLRHLSQQNADKIDLFLTERLEGTVAMASNEPVEQFLSRTDHPPNNDIVRVLNDYVKIHEVYDLMVLVDSQGIIRATNSMNRFGDWLDGRLLNQVVGHSITTYPEEAACWRRAMQGLPAVHDWYRSSLVHTLYFFEDDDVSRNYHVLFAQPVIDRRSGQPVGAWLNIMNWEYIQAIMDLVENDFKRYSLSSGYALLLDREQHKILAAPDRRNRRSRIGGPDCVGVDISRDPRFASLYHALKADSGTIHYVMGTSRYGGVTPIGNKQFGWVVLVSLSAGDIFRPADQMKYVFAVIILAAMTLILAGALGLSRHLSRPLARLKDSALEIARGHYSQRVKAGSSDEIGVLAEAFNRMALTIEERQGELERINQDLEAIVHERTQALEQSNQELLLALQDLRDAQDHLVQSEKMASLGQLIAGIAHEIKNPLNFIYGNTEFLTEYVEKIRDYVRFAESQLQDGNGSAEAIRSLRDRLNLEFIMKDLQNLARNVHDGAERIRSIVDDLRTFSRASSGSRVRTDLRKVVDMCLNLLRNQYKNRIRIHRDYEEVDPVPIYLGKMEQVFMNLLTNAIQAIDGDGDIWVRVGRNDHQVMVTVEDNGCGIPPIHLKRIFEPFFSTKDVGQGTGLGLSISYNIVQQHGGTLHAANRQGGGAVFRVTLPMNPPPDEGSDE